uniref:cellulase n=1 Tax=Ciona savignyi TaxID=51511 RepID=H2YH71_CIOSA
YNYAEALAKSMLFYEAQRSGTLPSDQRVPWRSDSGLSDGADNNIDLAGGYYDGAGYIKYNFPMAFSTTLLSWGVIRYKRTYEALGQLDYVLDTIKWTTDYFIKCHPEPDVFYGQVSDNAADSQYFGRPEDMNYQRRSYKIDFSNSGTDLAAEAAATMASAAIVFRSSNPSYAATLQQHAVELYDFATNAPRRSYKLSIQPAAQAYGGSGKYNDELAWAALWLYKLTRTRSYFNDAKLIVDRRRNGLLNLVTEFSWSDKAAGVQLLMSELSANSKYRSPINWFCLHSQPVRSNLFQTQSQYTNRGLLFINEWGPLRYAANTAFLCAMAADNGVKTDQNRVLAQNQINYMLGSTGRSFVVGFGQNPPTKIFHKSSYCPQSPSECNEFSPGTPNAYTLYGALVGGPGGTDNFMGQRMNHQQSSVTLDFNAGFQSALAALLDLHIYGEDDRPDSNGVYVQATTSDYKCPHTPTATTVAPPIPVSGLNYSGALEKSLLFYEAQRSGLLPIDNRVRWRDSSLINDGSSFGFNMSGGYYDGVTNVKFNFPMCFSMTMLAWGIIEYKDAYQSAGQYLYALDALKWGTDYIEKMIQNRTIVGQVGDPSVDIQTWDRPERLSADNRAVYTLQGNNPGTDLTAEVSAALAAASIAFKSIDYQLAIRLFNKSRHVYHNIARQTPQGLYQYSITSVFDHYPSSGFQDELAWAAAWLFKASKNKLYQNRARRHHVVSSTEFSATKNLIDRSISQAGVQLMLDDFDKQDLYPRVATFCNWMLDSGPRTADGLLHLNSAYPAKYAANAAFILMLAYEKFPRAARATEWRALGIKQINYLLGDNRKGQSFVVGFGDQPPTQPLHKGSSCPLPPAECGREFREVNSPNPNVLYGALVGGPNEMDDFSDLRTLEDQSSVSLDGNAGFQAAVA